MDKVWELYDFDQCPSCGGDAEILTESLIPGELYDGEKARCRDCGLDGKFSCDSETLGDIEWQY